MSKTNLTRIMRYMGKFTLLRVVIYALAFSIDLAILAGIGLAFMEGGAF